MLLSCFDSDDGKWIRQPKVMIRSSPYPLLNMMMVPLSYGDVFLALRMLFLFIIEIKINRCLYLNIFENQILLYFEENLLLLWIFQRDNDSLLNWPSQRTDLNPIKNFGEQFDRQIRSKKF